MPHRITVIESGDRLFAEACNDRQRRLFTFDLTKFHEVTEGRIGFRQICTHRTRYANITISTADN